MDIQQASSSSSPTLKNCKYEVFLSFRGEDTRKTFTDHLHFALKQRGINAFRDDENLRRGQTISTELIQAIKNSRISVIVFSENYASSTWCLDELAQVHECMKDGTQIVVPIFCGVDPSEVRKQTGRYGEAIAKHEIALPFWESGEKVAKWKTALTDVVNQAGWDLKDRHEAEAIQEIVEDIFTKLRRNCSGASDGLVGIDSRLDELIDRLRVGSDDVQMVAIWGMAGIGKTTLAKVVFEKLSSQFDGSCFLSDVREADERHDLVSLQEQLIDDILGTKTIKVRSKHQGINLISQGLRRRKVLVVLDDVNKREQLESLAGSLDWFGPGSRVIITTRDEHLSLKYGLENKPYRIKGLDHEESFKLLCTKAFDNEYPAEGYSELSDEVVTYCGGLPMALQVLGSFFRGRSVAEWQSALARLKEIPDNDIMDKLQIGFNGLEETEKKIFLDIACFFKGEKKDYITAILDACGFYPDIGLSVLKEKSLVTVDPKNHVSMHDLLQQMGREIVRQESPQEPGNRSRLWRYRDAYHVLQNDTGTDKVEGIVLDSHQTTEGWSSAKAFRRMTKESEKVEDMVLNDDSQEVPRSMSSKSFLKMKKLRLLRVPNLRCLQGQEYLSNELRYLGGNGYPFESLPSSFHPDKLVELHLSHSNIKQLWERKQPPFGMLRVINLSHSQNLIKTPNFNEVPNLEELILEGCTRLHEVHQSIGILERLVLLNLKDCRSLKELPSTICDLKSLKNLILHGCTGLRKLPERLGNLTCLEVLDLGRDVANEQPPTSLWDFLWRPWQLLPWKDPSPAALTLPSLSPLRLLRDLDLSYRKLREGAIPNDLGCFPLLETLNLSGNDFRSLPTSIGQLAKVQTIFVKDCRLLETIPGSISGLSNLQTLELINCSSVKSLPDLPTSIFELALNDCASLETLPNNFSGLCQLSDLFLDNCKSLRTLPDLPSGIVYLTMKRCTSLEAPPDLSGSLNSISLNFYILNCLKLTEKQDVFGWLKKYLHSILKNKRQGLAPPPQLSVLMSSTGGGIPGWFNYACEGRLLIGELPRYWFNNECLGFCVCVVLGFHDSVETDNFFVDVDAWVMTENPVSFRLYHGAYHLAVDPCYNSDVVSLHFMPLDESKRGDWRNSSHLVVSISAGKLEPKYIGFRMVYEQDVEELSRCNWTSSSAPFHNVVSTNERSYDDDDGCSSDSQVETYEDLFDLLSAL